MLDTDRLRKIPWGDLHHAYGAAADVPDLIEGLIGSGHGGALDQLYGSITHQGTRYEATAPAVPFLVDVVLDPAVAQRPEIVFLVGFAAMGFQGDSLDWRAQRAAQTGPHERACWDAVVGEHLRLEPMLTDPDPRLAGAVLHLLAWTGDDSPAVRRRIDDLLRSLDPDERLSGLLASTILGIALPVDLAAPPAGVDRFGWAAAALRFAGDACPPAAVDELVRTLTTERDDLAANPFSWGESPDQLAAAALHHVPAELLPHASDALLTAMGPGWAWGAGVLAVYLRLHLGEPDVDRASTLTDAERAAVARALEVVDRWDLGRSRPSQPIWELRAYGLPETASDLR